MATEIDYYYSIRSSFAYLGAGRLAEIAARHGTTIHHKPIKLPIVLPPIGGQPLEQRPPLRRAYAQRDLLRWADYLGIEIHADPIHHPGPQELPAGIVVAAQRWVRRRGGAGNVDLLSQSILEALWRYDRDIANNEVLARLVKQAGFDPAILLAEAMDESIQLEIDRNCREAIVRGVMGSPTYFVGDEPFFGQDRLEFVDRALAAAT